MRGVDKDNLAVVKKNADVVVVTPLEDVRTEAAVPIDDTEPLAVLDVLPNEPFKELALARPGTTDHVHMRRLTHVRREMHPAPLRVEANKRVTHLGAP
jgi:hypothetical protein